MRKLTEQDIIEFLTSRAELEYFFVSKSEFVESGLVCCFNSDGQAMLWTGDDDVLSEACVEFLLKRDAPILNHPDDIKNYWEKNLKFRGK